MASTSVCLLIFALVGSISAEVGIPEDLQEYIDALHDDCLSKSGITEERHKSYELSDKDPIMMCYMKCLMLSSKWMAPDGKIQYDFILDNIHSQVKPIVEAALNKCRVVEEGADLCEKAYNFNICMSKADPVNYFLV